MNKKQTKAMQSPPQTAHHKPDKPISATKTKSYRMGSLQK